MTTGPIQTEAGLEIALARVDEVWGAEVGSPEGDELERLALLIEQYEDQHCPIPATDPIDAVKFRTDQQGLAPSDLDEGHLLIQ